MNEVDNGYMSPENQQHIQRRVNAFLNEIKEFVPNAAVFVNSGSSGSPKWFTLELCSGDLLSLRMQTADWLNANSQIAMQNRLNSRPLI